MASSWQQYVRDKPVSSRKTYRTLRPAENESLKTLLNNFSDDATKITPEEILFKKGLIKWLKELIKNGMDRHIFRTFNSGSAYEKLQAGEATDFDIMFFLNIGRWTWKMESADHPGYCSITREAKEGDNERSYRHLIDEKGRLSALKVRRWFTSRIDRVLAKKSPLMYKYKVKVKQEGEGKENEKTEEREVEVKVSRKQKGPATTLLIEVEKQRPFTLDLVHAVNSLHVTQTKPYIDFVAKPFNRQNPFDPEQEHLWRKSYSRHETKKLRSIDDGNKIHRKLLRIMKILGRHQSQLKHLPTYYYKNLILFLSDDETKSWTDADIADRFVDIIISLRDHLHSELLPMYYNPNVNLLALYKKSDEEGTSSEPLKHIAGYLRRIANKGLPGYEEMLKTETKSHQSAEMNLRDRRKRKRQSRAKRLKRGNRVVKRGSANRRKKHRLATLASAEKPADWIPHQERKARLQKTTRTNQSLLDIYDALGLNELSDESHLDSDGGLYSSENHLDMSDMHDDDLFDGEMSVGSGETENNLDIDCGDYYDDFLSVGDDDDSDYY